MLRRALLLAACLAAPARGSLKELAHCDPLRKDMRCPPDPAFAARAGFNFSSAGWDGDGVGGDFWLVDRATARDRRRLAFGPGGVAVGLFQPGDAPTLVSRNYLLFGRVAVTVKAARGRVAVTVKAARGRGVVTAITLKSDSGDEIDWELLGAYERQAASNYFYDGKAVFNTYNDTYALATSSFDAYHTYAIEWTESRLVFSVDGVARKTWRPGANFQPAAAWPQTPMQLKLGVWAVADAADPGELRWAGGAPDWRAGAPFTAHFAAVDVDDYMGGCRRLRPGAPVRYRYDERTVGWRHVLVDGCDARVAGADLATAEPSAASSAASSAGASSTPAPDEDDAASLITMSSPLAAVVGLCWLLLL